MAIPVTLRISLAQGAFTLELDEQFEARATALFGPSGAGKTTVLEAIAGLRRPQRGSIRIGSHVLLDTATGVDLPPRARQLGYVPQDVALFPHLTVHRNVLYGARRGARFPLGRVIEVLEINDLLDRRIDGLSGGEQQRVACARALMSAPDLLLLDEPLAAVDAPLRGRIVEYLQRIRDELRVPLLYVSHDAAEVKAIADTALVLEGGRVVRIGAPDAVLGPSRAV
jgi:molybdate transport system ATP-binding protein